MANNSFIETIATGTYEVSKTRYDRLIETELKYNQLFKAVYDFPKHLYDVEGDQFNSKNVLIVIDDDKFKKINKEDNDNESTT